MNGPRSSLLSDDNVSRPGLQLTVSRVARGPVWTVVDAYATFHGRGRGGALGFDCGGHVVSVPVPAGRESLTASLIFPTDIIRRSMRLSVHDAATGATVWAPLDAPVGRLNRADLILDFKSGEFAGRIVNLTDQRPGLPVRVRFFDAVDHDLVLERDARVTVADSCGPVASSFRVPLALLMQQLRARYADIEAAWERLPKIAFLGEGGETLAEATLPAPLQRDGRIEQAGPERIAGRLLTGPFPASLDVLIDDVRYRSVVTDAEGRFALAPALPDPEAREAEIAIVPLYSRRRLTVAPNCAPVPLPPAPAAPRADWSWIGLRQLARRRITVIVPVYNAPDDLAACLAALAADGTGIDRVLVSDDASPDPRVAQVLARHAGGRVEIIRHAGNLGYTANINRAIEHAGDDDVILLNSDTVPPPGFAPALRLAAYSAPDVASATALSDNAGAFSAPEPGRANACSPQLDRMAMARLVRQAGIGAYPRVPTGNGFCLYLRRDALTRVGAFDETTFPRGYGEENDWCLRALALGRSHVIDDRTYVHHARSRSFGTMREQIYPQAQAVLRDRYPDYDERIRVFEEDEALLDMRWRIRAAVNRLAAGSLAPPRPRVLHLVAGAFDRPVPTDASVETYALAIDPAALALWRWRAGTWQTLAERAMPGHFGTDVAAAAQALIVRHAIDRLAPEGRSGVSVLSALRWDLADACGLASA